MPSIVDYVKVHQRVDAFLIEDETCWWVSCQETAGDGLGVFWSLPRSLSEAAEPEDIFDQLRNRLTQLSPDRKNLLELLQFWPQGWEFWGIGVPERIAEYFGSDEFAVAVRRLRAG